MAAEVRIGIESGCGMGKRLGLAGALVVCVIALCSILVGSEPVTLEYATDTVHAFIAYEQAKGLAYGSSLDLHADVALDGVGVLSDSTSLDALAYVFELKPSGYIVVTADTQMAPILAYSFSGGFSWEESPGNIMLMMLRQDLANRAQALREGQADPAAIAVNEKLWDEYDGLHVPLDAADYVAGVYGPWTLNPWSQRSPYWDECPVDPNTGSRCVVGCVATALSQILNYWQYPSSVTFYSSDNYTCTYDPGDGHGTRTIPIAAWTANFTGLNYNNCNPSDAAKADLSYAAGVSVRMSYSSAASSATTGYAASALAGSPLPWSWSPPQRWGYHSADVRTYTYSSWGSPYYVSSATFFSGLRGNMMQARPAQMSIQSSTVGHSIVVDGYNQSNGMYHLNYGWGATSYGWYSLPSGMPSGYDVVKYAVYNIVPTTSTYSMSTSIGGTGTGTILTLPGTGALTRGTHVLVYASAASGSTFSHWTGSLTGSENPAMLILDGNKSVTAVFDGTGGGSVWMNDPSYGDIWYVGDTETIRWSSSGAGSYVDLDYSIDDGDHWFPIATGAPNTGAYSWHVPATPSSTCKVKVTSGIDSQVYGESSRFTVAERTDWTTTIVDPTGGGGHYPRTSLCVDRLGRPHISYYDTNSPFHLKYVYRQEAGWTSPVVVDSTDWAGFSNSIAVDSDNQPSIAYYNAADDRLWYAYKIGSGWERDPVDPGTKVWDAALALDGNDIPHISYYVPYDSENPGATTGVKHAWLSNGSWITEFAVEALMGGRYSSLAVGPGDSLHLVYYDGNGDGGKIMYATRDASGWHEPEVLDAQGGNDFDGESSIEVDSTGVIHVAYMLGSTVKYARREGDAWVDRTVRSVGYPVGRVSLALDELGSPHIVYYSADDETIRYAYEDTLGWHDEAVAPCVGLDPSVSLGLDDGDGRHVSYGYQSDGDLRYAYMRRDPPPPPATPAVFRVDPEGIVLADGPVLAPTCVTTSADVAEWIEVSTGAEPGDVVELDPTVSERYRVSATACSSLLAGVISTEPGVTLGLSLDGSEKALLALVGIVPVHVTSEGGSIQPGDLLVSSSTPGHAMRWAGPAPCPCALVGKALEPMIEEVGMILVLLTAH